VNLGELKGQRDVGLTSSGGLLCVCSHCVGAQVSAVRFGGEERLVRQGREREGGREREREKPNRAGGERNQVRRKPVENGTPDEIGFKEKTNEQHSTIKEGEGGEGEEKGGEGANGDEGANRREVNKKKTITTKRKREEEERVEVMNTSGKEKKPLQRR